MTSLLRVPTGLYRAFKDPLRTTSLMYYYDCVQDTLWVLLLYLPTGDASLTTPDCLTQQRAWAMASYRILYCGPPTSYELGS